MPKRFFLAKMTAVSQSYDSRFTSSFFPQIGRGFVLWEPHLEVSKVILGLLEMCSEADWWVPSAKYGLPLTAGGDACRTSRHTLAQVGVSFFGKSSYSVIFERPSNLEIEKNSVVMGDGECAGVYSSSDDRTKLTNRYTVHSAFIGPKVGGSGGLDYY